VVVSGVVGWDVEELGPDGLGGVLVGLGEGGEAPEGFGVAEVVGQEWVVEDRGDGLAAQEEGFVGEFLGGEGR